MSALISKYGPEPPEDMPVRQAMAGSGTKASLDAVATVPMVGSTGALRAYYSAVKETDAVEELVWAKSPDARRAAILSNPSDYDVL